MFLFQDALGKGVLVVGIEDGDDGLQDDGAGVEIFVDKVDGASGELDAVIEGLLLRFEAGEGRQERRVNIDDALGKGGYEEGGEKAHVAGEADEIDFVFVEYGGDLAGVGFAFKAFGGDGARGNVAGGGALEAGGTGLGGNYGGDFGVRGAARGGSIGGRVDV